MSIFCLLGILFHLEFDTISYRTFKELAKDPHSGIRIRDAVDYFDFNPTGHNDRLPWWSAIVDDVGRSFLVQGGRSIGVQLTVSKKTM